MVEYLLRNHDHIFGIQHALLGMINVTSDQLAISMLAIRCQEATVLDEIAPRCYFYD